MGPLILIVSVPAAVWTALRVRRDDAEVWHSLVHAAAVGFVAFGIAWVAGYGSVGLVFFPVGAVLGLADAYFRIFNIFLP